MPYSLEKGLLSADFKNFQFEGALDYTVEAVLNYLHDDMTVPKHLMIALLIPSQGVLCEDDHLGFICAYCGHVYDIKLAVRSYTTPMVPDGYVNIKNGDPHVSLQGMSHNLCLVCSDCATVKADCPSIPIYVRSLEDHGEPWTYETLPPPGVKAMSEAQFSSIQLGHLIQRVLIAEKGLPIPTPLP